jgi:hypothetical protein
MVWPVLPKVRPLRPRPFERSWLETALIRMPSEVRPTPKEMTSTTTLTWRRLEQTLIRARAVQGIWDDEKAFERTVQSRKYLIVAARAWTVSSLFERMSHARQVGQ